MAAPDQLSELDQLVTDSIFAAQKCNAARQTNLARAIADARRTTPSEAERAHLALMRDEVIRWTPTPDDVLIDTLSDAAAAVPDLLSFNSLLRGLHQELLNCPDPHSPRTTRLRERVETLLSQSDAERQWGPYTPFWEKRARAFRPVSSRILSQSRIDILAIRINFLEQEATPEAAVELGAALAAIRALQGVVVVLDGVMRASRRLEPLAEREETALADQFASPSCRLEPVIERDNNALSKRFAPDVRRKDTVPGNRSAATSRGDGTEIQAEPSRQQQQSRTEQHNVPSAPMKFSSAAPPMANAASSVLSRNEERPMSGVSPVQTPGQDPRTRTVSSTVKGSKGNSARRDSHAEQQTTTSDTPRSNSPERQPWVKVDVNMSKLVRETAELNISHSERDSGPVSWTSHNKRFGRWFRAGQAAEEGEIASQAWSVVSAEVVEDAKRNSSGLNDQAVKSGAVSSGEEGATLEGFEVVESLSNVGEEVDWENFKIIGEQGEWVVIRPEEEGVGTIGRRVRRKDIRVAKGKVALRKGAWEFF